MTLPAMVLDSFASFKSDFATIGTALSATRISLSVVRTTLPATWMILPTMEIVLDSFELISCMQSNEKVRYLGFFCYSTMWLRALTSLQGRAVFCQKFWKNKYLSQNHFNPACLNIKYTNPSNMSNKKIYCPSTNGLIITNCSSADLGQGAVAAYWLIQNVEAKLKIIPNL